MKTAAKLVTTQSALDKALAEDVIDLIVDAPNGAWLEIWHDGLVRLWESSRVVARGSSRVEAWDSSRVVAGRWVVVHLWSQRVTLTGTGHIIDMTAVDLADVDIWREHVGAYRPADPDAEWLVVGRVSSQDHEGRLGRDGRITIGCWAGDVSGLRALAAGKRWPSGADAETRARFAPRLVAFADMCEAQIEAWSTSEAVQ